MQEMSKKDYLKSNPYAMGWESIEDMSRFKLEVNFTEYLSLAQLQYLDEEYEKKNK